MVPTRRWFYFVAQHIQVMCQHNSINEAFLSGVKIDLLVILHRSAALARPMPLNDPQRDRLEHGARAVARVEQMSVGSRYGPLGDARRAGLRVEVASSKLAIYA
jgi:hypothetical protein